MLKRILIFAVCLLISAISYSQVRVLIKVLDENSGNPVPYCTGIYHLVNGSDNTQFSFSDKGIFELDSITEGKYNMSISCLGYQSKDTVFEVAGKDIELPVSLKRSISDLQDVSVRTQKRSIEMNKGKFILNVQQSVLTNASSAWDALKYAPTVMTSTAGSLTVMNKPAIVYIDDRRVYLSGDELMQYLQGISASNVDQIEVIAHSDASYSADISSVIKLSTLKSKEDGLKGNLTFRGISSSFFSGSLGANTYYKKDKFYLHSGYSYNYIKNKVLNKYELLGRQGFPWDIPQQSVIENYNNRFFSTLGYYFNQNNKLAIYVDLPYTISKTNLFSDNGIYSAGRPAKDSIFQFRSSSQVRSFSFQSQLTYQTVFDNDKQHLKFELEYFDNNQSNRNAYQSLVYDQEADHYMSAFKRMDKLPQRLHTFIGSVTNSTKLFGEDFSYGLRYSQNSVFNNDATFDISQITPRPINKQDINYYEKNYAAYSSWEKQLKRLYVQLGIRLERNTIEATSDSLNGAPDFRWLNVFPNILFQYSKSDSSYWMLSFNKSFKRPDYYLLNPYQRYTKNSTAQFEGNASILPQKNFDISLGWTNNRNITIYGGYLVYKDMISTLYLQDSISGNLYQKYDNFYLNGAYITATYTINIRNWWRTSFDGYGLFFKTRYKKIKPGKFSPIISANLTNDFTVTPSTQIGFSLYYKPTYSDGYFTHYGQGNVNFAITQKLKNTNISLSIFGNDVFKNDQYKEMALYEIHYLESGYMDSRQFGLSLVWKFGKQTVKNKKQDRLESDDSKDRL